MIDFHIDEIRVTGNRFAELSKSAGRQHSEVTSSYHSIKSALTEKINSLNSDISKAENERHEAQSILAKNNELASRIREQLRVAKERIGKYEKEKSEAEGQLKRVEASLSVLRQMSDGKNGSSMVSLLESKASRLSSEIRTLEKDIESKQDEIDKLEKKLEAIEKANSNLEKIISAIDKIILQLRSAVKQMQSIASAIVSSKENYDSIYNMTKHGMVTVHERTANALKAGSDALYQFSIAGCGNSKSVKVDSPETIYKMSMDIHSAASHISNYAFDLKCEADVYRSRLKDKISEQIINEVKKSNEFCDQQSKDWETKATSLKNAGSYLGFYLECKM